MNAMFTPTREAQPSAVEVLSRLKAAHAVMGGEGRIALTYSVGSAVEAYVTHWFRPDPHAFEDCKAIGQGTIAHCLNEVERYAAERAANAQQEAA